MRKKGERTYAKNAAEDTFKSKLMIDTAANASETYNEVFRVCLKTSSKRRAAIWGQRFGKCGDSSQRVTRPHRGSLKTFGPFKRRRRDGTYRKGAEQSSRIVRG